MCVNCKDCVAEGCEIRCYGRIKGVCAAETVDAEKGEGGFRCGIVWSDEGVEKLLVVYLCVRHLEIGYCRRQQKGKSRYLE